MTVMRNTVMLSIVEMPRVIFSPDSAGMRKTNLKCGYSIFIIFTCARSTVNYGKRYAKVLRVDIYIVLSRNIIESI